MAYFKHYPTRMAARSAAWSAALGTLLFLVALATGPEALVGPGLAFILVASFLNTLVLLVLFVSALIHYREIQEFASAIVLLMLNLPLALLYIHILSFL